jgi:C4-dicarboxylate transporter DctM subunit
MIPDTFTVALILFGGLALLILLRVPIGFALGISGVLTLLYTKGSFLAMAQTYYDAVDSFPLMAIPLFFLAGSIMEMGGISRRLVDVAEAMIGNIRGGLGMVTILSSMFFSAISGSGPATTAAVGGVMIPAMKRRNYERNLAAAIAATGGTMGVLIPPSILLILFGVSADESITKLFIAAMLPGVVIGFSLMIAVYIICRIKGIKTIEERFSMGRLFRTIWHGKFSILAPVIILGGIYAGVFTPTESAVVAVIYGWFVATFIYRELKFKNFLKALDFTVNVTGKLGIIWAVSKAYGEIMTLYQIPLVLSQYILEITQDPFLILVLISVFLTFIGMWMNSIAQVIIFTPIFLPVITTVGISPIHFAIIFVVNAEVGFLTPPLGTNLFVSMEIADSNLGGVAKSVIPLLGVLFLMILVIILFPQISLFLPELLAR